MNIRRLIALLAVAFVTLHAGGAGAQGASAPLPNQSAPAAKAAPPFPSGGTGPLVGDPRPPDACMKGFAPLRNEAERRGRLVKAAADRKAPKDEACKLVTHYGEAEARLLDYVEANAARCAIPQKLVDQIRTGRKQTEALLLKICGAPLVSDAGDPASAYRITIGARRRVVALFYGSI